MLKIRTQTDIQDMARGAVFLGAGGGGDPLVGELFLHNQLSLGRTPKIIPASELDDDAFVLSIAGIGAPTTLLEYLVSEKHLLTLLERAEKFYGRKVDALISAEIGGANSMFPMSLGAIAGIPVVDADGMGRAFPHLEMVTFSVYGSPASPMILSDELGNVLTIDALSDGLVESLARPIVNVLGAMAFSGIYPMTGKFVREYAVHGTVTHTVEIGRCIRKGREDTDDVFGALIEFLDQPDEDRHARVVFDGKIVDARHENRDGWHWGEAVIQPLGGGSDRLVIQIQNEYLITKLNAKTVTVVPDIIAVLDRETAEPLTAEMLRYGQRVKVIGYSAAPIMRRPECLDVWGPRCHGLDEDYQDIKTLLD